MARGRSCCSCIPRQVAPLVMKWRPQRLGLRRRTRSIASASKSAPNGRSPTAATTKAEGVGMFSMLGSPNQTRWAACRYMVNDRLARWPSRAGSMYPAPLLPTGRLSGAPDRETGPGSGVILWDFCLLITAVLPISRAVRDALAVSRRTRRLRTRRAPKTPAETRAWITGAPSSLRRPIIITDTRATDEIDKAFSAGSLAHVGTSRA
jgi:hypothetical protein